ncbi:fungal hydrophobin [Nemania sp. FL0916]|nr:fungal hydrophobin [Nemania sp. FL0916]
MANPVVKRTGGDGGHGGGNPPTPYDACSGLYDSLQCCATDVLGVADLDCQTPSAVPRSASDFQAICAKGGQRARCCVIPVAEQDVLCQTPLGL